ncbi:MAG TPA: hypothetical protein VET87_11185, partial [Rubrivivax sp.]|nr:hypothetical protein [Rubrivivax sp.]
QQLMEVSLKAPVVQAAVAIGGFMAYLAEVGAERDDSEQTKTRWAMAFYADKLTPAPAGSGKAKAPLARKTAAKAAAAKPMPARRSPAKKAATTNPVAAHAPAPGARQRATALPARKAAPARAR